MMRGYFGTFGGFGWLELVFVVIMTAVLFGVVVSILYFIRSMRRRPNQDVSRAPAAVGSQVLTPKDIVQARYARGEITREQYLAILEDLK
jgi:uncharacterized membrane protein